MSRREIRLVVSTVFCTVIVCATIYVFLPDRKPIEMEQYWNAVESERERARNESPTLREALDNIDSGKMKPPPYHGAEVEGASNMSPEVRETLELIYREHQGGKEDEKGD